MKKKAIIKPNTILWTTFIIIVGYFWFGGDIFLQQLHNQTTTTNNNTQTIGGVEVKQTQQITETSTLKQEKNEVTNTFGTLAKIVGAALIALMFGYIYLIYLKNKKSKEEKTKKWKHKPKQ